MRVDWVPGELALISFGQSIRAESRSSQGPPGGMGRGSKSCKKAVNTAVSDRILLLSCLPRERCLGEHRLGLSNGLDQFPQDDLMLKRGMSLPNFSPNYFR